MKKTVCAILSISVLLSFSCKSIDKDVFIKRKEGLKKNIRIAVMPFKDAGDAEGSGIAVANSIANEIIKIKNWDIVERSQLKKIVGEQAFDASGMTDSKYSALGKLMKTDYIIVGSVSDYSYVRKYYIIPKTKLAYSCRIIDTTKGTVVGTARMSLETGTYAICCCLLGWIYYIPYAMLTDENINEDVADAAERIVDDIKDEIED